MALPADLGLVDIIGFYVDYTGAPVVGTIEFSAAVPLVSAGTHTAVRPAVVIGRIVTGTGALKAADGTSTLQILATDDPDESPTGWTWTVTEKLTNSAGVNVSKLPFNLIALAASSPIDLPEASPSTPPNVPGAAAVTKINALLPNSAGLVTMTAADIPAAAVSHNHAGADIASGTVAYGRMPVGTSASTVAAGNDARFTDARFPTAHATSHATAGADPISPASIGAAPTSHAHSGADITTGTVAYARLPVGTVTSTITAGDDSRLSNARTPTSHASTHATAGSDPITPAAIGAEVSGTAASAISTHLAAGDPHPQYLTPAEGAAAYAAISHTHTAADLSGLPLAPTFSMSGPVATVTGTYRWYNDTGRTLGVTALRVSAGVAPTGGPLTIVAKKNGAAFSSTLTATITAASNTGVTSGAGQTIASGDYITIDVTLVGTTVTGSDLTVVLTLAVA